jgi:putative DNA methylase
MWIMPDLSDYFYVWLRKMLSATYPEIFATLLVPKTEELVATHTGLMGVRRKSKDIFRKRFGSAFKNISQIQIEQYPLTIFYAFKQMENKSNQKG